MQSFPPSLLTLSINSLNTCGKILLEKQLLSTVLNPVIQLLPECINRSLELQGRALALDQHTLNVGVYLEANSYYRT